jgi:type VI protein secretion system component VasK
MSKKKMESDLIEKAPNEIENISKIRDILFGNNMNEYEKRFEKLETKLALSVAENKAETDKKMASLEGYFKNEIKILNEKLVEEEDSRKKSDKRIISDIESLEESFKKFKVATADNLSANNQQLLDLNNAMSDQMTELNRSLINRLDNSSNELQNNKVDRSSLAMMLTDLAYNIAGENESSNALDAKV